MEKIAAKSILVVLSITTIMVGSLVFICNSSTRDSFRTAELDDLQRTVNMLVTDLSEQSKKAASRASFATKWPVVIEAYKHMDRDLLYQSIWPSFEQQGEKFGVREAQFLTRPVISFLRVYAPHQGYGEDLSTVREMLLTADKTGLPQQGIEIGRRGLSIRGVDLIKDEKGSYLGILEVGLSFSTILDNLKKNTGFDAGVFIDNDLMSKIATLFPKPCLEEIVGKYRIVESTNWKLIQPFIDPDEFRKAKGNVLKTIEWNGNYYGTILFPLLDYRGRQIGFILAVKNYAAQEKILKQNLTLLGFFGVLEIAAIGASLFLVFRRFLLKPIGRLKKNASKWERGEDVPIDSLLKNDDELGELAQKVKKMSNYSDTPFGGI